MQTNSKLHLGNGYFLDSSLCLTREMPNGKSFFKEQWIGRYSTVEKALMKYADLMIENQILDGSIQTANEMILEYRAVINDLHDVALKFKEAFADENERCKNHQTKTRRLQRLEKAKAGCR